MKRFRKIERFLRAQGHITINQTRLTQGLKDYTQISGALIEQADAVFFMHDWQESVGAKIEFEQATKANKIIIYEELRKPEILLKLNTGEMKQ